jgi:TM2 domain-containing membrane protein YozV
LSQYVLADKKLATFMPEDSTLIELKKFQQAASALMQRDFLTFEKIGQSFTYNNFSCAEEQKELFKRKQDIIKNKRKSPLLAGLMSAVVPGSGKFYAGYRGQAISAMVPTFIFAAAAAESYYRAGPKSAQFITTASLFGIFYVGNIWGSVLSVKTFYELRNNEIHNNVMLDLHIPLRRIFSN